MKKIILLLLCAVFVTLFATCSEAEKIAHENTPESNISTPETPKETSQPPAEPIETVEIHSARMWNEFARSYNSERENYADYVTVEITLELDFENVDFVPLADGFSGKITAGEPALTDEQRTQWIEERKKWPLDYRGTFMNISSIEDVNGERASSLFGSVDELELENVSFAFIYLGDVKCLVAENAGALELNNVRVQNCTLPDGRAIAAVNTKNISIDGFIAESCMLTGYEYMAGLVCFVAEEAAFKDVILCRCSFTLSPDNGGSGLWSAGIGLLAKSVNGIASFESIDVYGCDSTGLYTHALTGSAGNVSKCSDITLDFCTFMNYRPMESEFNSGIIGFCGENRFMETPVLEENVSITNCNIGGEYVKEDFTARGYRVENCIFTSSKEKPPQ